MASIVNSQYVNGSATTSLTFTPTSGNVLVLMTSNNGVTGVAPTIADGEGGTWTTSGTQGLFASSANQVTASWKVSDGGEVSIAAPATGQSSGTMAIWEISGVSNNPIIIAAGPTAHSNVATATTHTTTAISTTNAKTAVVALVGLNGASGTITAWTGILAMNNIQTATARSVAGSVIPVNALSGRTFTANWTTTQTNGSLVVAFDTTLTPVVSDTTSHTESITMMVDADPNISDATTTSENISVQIQTSIAVSDTTVTSEAVTMLIPTLFINVSDTTTTSESVSVQFPGLTPSINVSDTTVTSESISLLNTNFINVSDTTTTSESIVINESAVVISTSDTTTTSENVTLLIPTLFISVSDTTVTSESVALLGINFINKSDTTTTSESITVKPQINVSVSDTTITSENITLLIPTLYVGVSDTTVTTELLTFAVAKSILVSDTTTTSELATVGTPYFPVNVRDTSVTSENISVVSYTSPIDINVHIVKAGGIKISVVRQQPPTFKMKVGAL